MLSFKIFLINLLVASGCIKDSTRGWDDKVGAPTEKALREFGPREDRNTTVVVVPGERVLSKTTQAKISVMRDLTGLLTDDDVDQVFIAQVDSMKALGFRFKGESTDLLMELERANA